MRKIFAVLLLSLIFYTCNRTHELTRDEVEAKLKQTMHDYLMKGRDSNFVKYDIVKIIFYEAPDVYNCDFKVHMQLPKLDTIGEMKANIKKDFSKVVRIF